MTRNWIALASRNLRLARPGSDRTRRQRTGLCLETLEHRLSLSGLQGNHIGYGAIVGNHIGTNMSLGHPADLNPQPLPPGVMVDPMIVGNHIGSPAIVGNHIGYEMVVVAIKH